jgi:2-alkenal reductase
VQPGDTVFVSGGAGSVGSMAGQIARLLGAGLVIGSTGSREKGDRLVNELGYDAAVIRGAGPIAEQLAKAAPEGIDVVLDNVGGQELRAAVTAARKGARFALVGALSGQLSPSGTGTTSPVELDSYMLIGKQITMRGYSAGSDGETGSQWLDQFANWLRSGDISLPLRQHPGHRSRPTGVARHDDRPAPGHRRGRPVETQEVRCGSATPRRRPAPPRVPCGSTSSRACCPHPGAPPPGNAATAPRRSPAYASFANSSPSA